MHVRIRMQRCAQIMRTYTLVALGGVLAFSTGATAQVANPTVTGPIAQPVAPGDPSHNYIFFSSNHDLAGHGYVEEEFFVSGTATRYATPNQNLNPPDARSTGTVISTGNAYKTRVVVRRPANPAKFNGVVLVEWYNVTNNFDAENVWFFNWENIMRSGYVWVGVSAQRVGVNALKTWSPTRYGTLDVTVGNTVTDDSLSYDVYSQVGQAISSPGAVDMLHGLVPSIVIATGESQSAMRLALYYNSIQPLHDVYDGVLALSTLGNRVRVDLPRPFFKVLTESDTALFNEANVRQDDPTNPPPMFRSWEVAGSSHVDQHLRNSREPLELRDNGISSEATNLDPPAPTGCTQKPVGTRVPTTYVLSSAYDKLVRWITNGTRPPYAPPIQFAGTPSVPVRNSLGLAQGGIQLSQQAVPTRINSGVNSGPGACNRWGFSLAIDAAQIDSMYPNRLAYFQRVAQVDKANAIAGYILQADLIATMTRAAQFDISGLYEGP